MGLYPVTSVLKVPSQRVVVGIFSGEPDVVQVHVCGENKNILNKQLENRAAAADIHPQLSLDGSKHFKQPTELLWCMMGKPQFSGTQTQPEPKGG